MTGRARAVGGAAAIGLYLLVAALSYRAGLLPVRPLYEGLAPPQPYRWVSPPPEVSAGNVPPEAALTPVVLGAEGSATVTVSTPDEQATVVLPDRAFEPREGETEVRVSVSPADPATIGPPPGGLRYDSNAYEITAAYAASGEPAAFTGTATILLRYAFGSNTLYRRDAGTWVALGTTPVASTLRLFADSDALGTFVAVGAHLASQDGGGGARTDLIAAGAGLAVTLGGIALARTRRTARRKARKGRGPRRRGPKR